MGLFNHLFKHKPSQEEEKMGENGESSHDPGVSEPSQAPPPDPSSFLHPKAYVPRGGGAPIVPGSRSPSRPVGKPSERNIHFQATQPVPGEIVLTLGDVLSRIPTQLLKMGLHDAKRELRFKIGDLSSDIARGRAAVPLSRIAALCPDIFQREITADEDMEVRLPLQKLVEQIALMRSSGPLPLLERESRITRSETPPMMLPARTPAPAPVPAQEPNVELKSAEPHSLPANAFELKPQALVPPPPSPPVEVSKTLEERALKLDAGAHSFIETKVTNEALPQTPSTPPQPPGNAGSPSRPNETPPAEAPALTQQITPPHIGETLPPAAPTPSTQESTPPPSSADIAKSALIELLRLKTTLPEPAPPDAKKAVLETRHTESTEAISEPAPPPAESTVTSALGDFPELEAFFSGMVFPDAESGMSGAIPAESVAEPAPPSLEESIAKPAPGDSLKREQIPPEIAPPKLEDRAPETIPTALAEEPEPAPPLEEPAFALRSSAAKSAPGDSLIIHASPAEAVPPEPVAEIPAVPPAPLAEAALAPKPETQISQDTSAHSLPDVAPDPSQPSLPSVQNDFRSKGFLPDLAPDEPKTEPPAPKRKNRFEDYLKQVPRPQPSKESIAKAALIGLYQLRAIVSDISLLEAEFDPLESGAAGPPASSDQFSIPHPPLISAKSKQAAAFVVAARSPSETEASGSRESSVSEIILGYPEGSEPALLESETTHSADRICLSLASILKTCPPEIVAGELPQIDEDLEVELPLTQIEAQLASGSVEISSLRFIAALPPEYMKYFVVREDVKVPLPLEEIFMRLPHPIGQNVSVAEAQPLAFAESGEAGEASHQSESDQTPLEQNGLSSVESRTTEPPPANASLKFDEVGVSEPLPAAPEFHEAPFEEKAPSAAPLPPPLNPEPAASSLPDPLPELKDTSQISQGSPISPTTHPEAPLVEPQPPATAAPSPIESTPVASGEDLSPVDPVEELHWPPAKEPADPPASPYESKTTAPTPGAGPFVLNIPAFRIFVPPSPPVFSSEATAINSPAPFNDTAPEPEETEEPIGVPAKAHSEALAPPEFAGKPSEPVDASAEAPSPEHKTKSPAPSFDPPIIESAKEMAAEVPVPAPASQALAPQVPQHEAEPSHPSLERMTLIRPPPQIRPVMIAPPRIFGGAPSSESRENLAPEESPSAEKLPSQPASQPDTKTPARTPTPIAQVSSAPEIAEAAKPISENLPDPAPSVPQPLQPQPQPPATSKKPAAPSPASPKPKLKLKPIVLASQKDQTPPAPAPVVDPPATNGNGEASAPIAASAPAPAPAMTIPVPKEPVLHVPPLPKPDHASPSGETPSAHPHPSPSLPPLPLLRFDQSVLQTLFMTDDLLDLPAICRHVAALPGLQACMISRRDETFQAGEFPEGFEISSLLAFAPGVKEVAGRLPIGALKNFTLYAEEHSVSFFERSGVCLCVVHRARSFIPGVREKLITVSDELSKA